MIDELTMQLANEICMKMPSGTGGQVIPELKQVHVDVARIVLDSSVVVRADEYKRLVQAVAAVAAEMNRYADLGVALYYYGIKLVAAIEGRA